MGTCILYSILFLVLALSYATVLFVGVSELLIDRTFCVDDAHVHVHLTGAIAASTNISSSKFVNPNNLGNIAANTDFTSQMAVSDLETGNFVNVQTNCYAAPLQVNPHGNVVGHTHFVVEQLESLTQTTPTDPTKLAFFKGSTPWP